MMENIGLNASGQEEKGTDEENPQREGIVSRRDSRGRQGVKKSRDGWINMGDDSL